MEPHRKAAFDMYGVKCALCGYADHPEALAVHHKVKKLRDFRYPALYKSYCLQHIDECQIICMNCKAVQMAEGREANQAPKRQQQKYYVYPSSHAVDGAAQFGFLDRKIAEGYRVMILAPTGEVWGYGRPYELIADNWERFAEAVGYEGPVPEMEVFI